MAKLSSTPTTVTVTALPTWLPVGGSWSSVALNKVNSPSVKGDFPPQFRSSRDIRQLFSDYTGAIWNPYFGTYGAWLIMGGGHQQYLGNEVYAWVAESRQWTRLSEPTYPGQNSTGTSLVTLGDWQSYKEPPFASDLLATFGELTPGVPASNHSRWHPCILPPPLGGGSKGSLLIGHLSSIHTSGNHQVSVAHAFDCASGKWSRLGSVSTLQDSGRAWSSCLDTTRGVIYRPGERVFSRLPIKSGAWESVGVSIYGTPFASAPCVYASTKDLVILLAAAGKIGILDAAFPTGIVTVTTAGKTPQQSADERRGLTWVPDLGPNGSICVLNYSSGDIYACPVPADPFKGTWTWVTLTRANLPTMPSYHTYNHFQYAPGLKCFFLANGETDEMWCFRPSEIAG